MRSLKPGDRLEKGTRLFLEERRQQASVTKEVEVIKVGRKYFDVGNLDGTPLYGRSRFELATWRQDTDYNPYYRLWPSETYYLLHQRKIYLATEIRRNITTTDLLKLDLLTLIMIAAKLGLNLQLEGADDV